jgi:hypothetical protein
MRVCRQTLISAIKHASLAARDLGRWSESILNT